MRTAHVVMYSGGVGSWMTARRVVEAHGAADVSLLFADTLIEDRDLYRFIYETAASLGAELVIVTEGRDPWEVFFDRRFLGNTRVALCSRILKRELLLDWIKQYCDPENTIIYLGYDWSEINRAKAACGYWSPWRVESPMCEPPYLNKQQMLEELDRVGIARPRLYEMGFPHNNCGGFCVKAGQAHFALLLRTMPERYAYHEKREQELREFLNKDIAILRDRTGGKTRPMTMREFRERTEAGGQIDLLEWGGCGCFSDPADEG